jgi:uncharacterized protein HemX
MWYNVGSTLLCTEGVGTVDKTVVFCVSIVFLIALLIIGSVFWYNITDQKALIERKNQCSQSQGIYIDTAQFQGCVRIISVEQ